MKGRLKLIKLAGEGESGLRDCDCAAMLANEKKMKNERRATVNGTAL